MQKTKIAGIGMYIPANVVTNNDLLKNMDTSEEWIQERTVWLTLPTALNFTIWRDNPSGG